MSLTPAAEPVADAATLPTPDHEAPVAAHAAATARDAIVHREFVFDARLPMRHAGDRRVVVRGSWHGPADAPVAIVAGGISANRRAAAHGGDPGWWPRQVGPGSAIDTRRVRVLAIDWLGADGALDAPIDPADQADALAIALDRLGIAQVHAFVGASYGACVGLHFAVRHGGRLRRLVAIAGAHRPHPYASAWRALQRQVVALARTQGGAAAGVALARQWALLSYRTPEEFAERFAAPAAIAGDVAHTAAEAWLAQHGRRFAARFSSTAFVRLSESLDLHAVDPADVRVPTTVVAVAEDRLVPLADLQALVEGLGGPARLRVLRSPYGHDAFLKEDAAIDGVLRDALVFAGGAA